MVSTNIRDFGKQLLAQHRISMARLDDAVRRILRVKFRAGLFEHPYVDQAKAADPASFVTADDRAKAREAAGKSMVLLKNDGAALPARPRPSRRVVIGPLGNDKHDMLGPVVGPGQGRRTRCRCSTASRRRTRNTTFAQGCTIEDKDPPQNTPEGECGTDAGFAAAVAAAQDADQIVLALGESRGQSGEAAARSEIDLPGLQQELIDAIKAAAATSRSSSCCSTARPLTSRRSPPPRRRSSRPGSRGPRPATPWPTCCSARSTPAASCRCRSRARWARSRSTTTTSPPGVRAT